MRILKICQITGLWLLLVALISTQVPSHAAGFSEKKREKRALRQEKQQAVPETVQTKDEQQAAPETARTKDEQQAVPETALTEDELQALTDGLDYAENGFFLSTYDRPEEINWEEVFYNGAGISVEPGEAALEFLRERDGDIMTSVFALRQADIADFVKEKTGTASSLARRPLSLSNSWAYYSQEDMYLTQHGDTNVQPIVFTSGTRQGSIYRLVYTAYDYETMAGTRDFVMTADIDAQGRWTYISNLPAGSETQKTLLTIDLYETFEEASQAAGSSAGFIEIEQLASDEPSWQFAVITSLSDDLHVQLDRALTTDGVNADWRSQLQWNWGITIPDTTLAQVTLMKGESVITNINMPWNPRIRISASTGEFYGEYWFGEDLYLHLANEDGSEAQRYVTGRDEAADHGALHPADVEGLKAMLLGSWIYYDPNTWEPAAALCFDKYGDISVLKPGPDSTYWDIEGASLSRKDISESASSGWISSLRSYLEPLYQVDGLNARNEWVYASASQAPDVLRITATDGALLEALPAGYGDEGVIGDYFILTQQLEDAEVLTLQQANNGTGLLGEFLPGTDYEDTEFTFYRFSGTSTWQSAYRDILANAAFEDARAMEYEGTEDFDKTVQEWYLCDMNADDVPELFITYGVAEAAKFTRVYTFADNEARQCSMEGEDPQLWTGHTALYSMPDQDGLLLWWGHMGYFSMNVLHLNGETMTLENLMEEEPPEEEAAYTGDYSFTKPEEYLEGAKALPWFNIHTLLPLRRYSQYNAQIRSYDPAANTGADEPAPGGHPDTGAMDLADAPDFISELEQSGGEVFVSAISQFVSEPGEISYEDIYRAGVLYEWSADLTLQDIRFADLDGDGNNEAVLYLAEEGARKSELMLILHKQDGKLYGYCDLAYGGEKLTADGVFCSEDDDGYRQRVMFDGPECFAYIVE